MTTSAALDLSALAPLADLVEQERQTRLGAGDEKGEETAPATSAPEMSDEKIQAGTGRGWDEWVALVADGPGRDASHSEIATWAGEQHGLAGWWAHGVAVGVRRLTGQRVPGQMADGSFAVSKSATLPTDAFVLRAALLDEGTRDALLPGLDVTLQSKPASKSVRLALADDDGSPLGSILVTLAPAGDGRCRVTVSHEKLTSTADGERWKTFWAGWLAVVAGALRS